MDYSLIFSDVRKILGLTQSKLAEEINVSRSTIASIEVGKQKPTLEIITSIVGKYNIDANVFFSQKNENQTIVLQEPLKNYQKSEHKNVNSSQEIIYLKKIIFEKEKQLEDKERMIKYLMSNKI